MTLPKVNQASAKTLEALWLATDSDAVVDLDQPGYLHFHAERIGAAQLAISHTFV